MRKRIITSFLITAGLLLVLVAVLGFLGFFRPKQAGLTIETEPSVEVFIDGNYAGVTPYDVSMDSSTILLQLIPEDRSLGNYETKVKLEPGVKTIIKRSFSGDDFFENGAVVSFEKTGTKDSYIAVVSDPVGVQISIDDKAYGFTPLLTKISAGDHSLELKLPGYTGKLLPIRVYKGYKLTAVVKLSKEKTEEKTQVKYKSGKIDETRVKNISIYQNADTSSKVIGNINPEEEFFILNEEEGWYEIEFESIVYGEGGGTPTKINGWIKKEFVKKIEP